MGKQFKGLLQELDFSTGSILLNKETLDSIRFGLGRIKDNAEKVKGEDPETMGLMLRDMHHNIVLVADLLHYTLGDFNENFENIDRISNELHQINSDKEIAFKRKEVI